MKEENRESFVRWQDYRVKQLSYSINIFLGFSIASIGFYINKAEWGPGNIQLNLDAFGALVWWSFSFCFGVFAVIARLVDFRYTALRIRSDRTKYRKLVSLASSITWVTFGVQLISFCIGVYIFIIESL